MLHKTTQLWELCPAHGAGPQITATQDGIRAVRNFVTPGDPLLVRKAIKEILGYSYVKTVGAYKYIARELPMFFPHYTRESDGLHYVWASGVQVIENYSIAGEDIVDPDDGQLPDYELAKLQVTYVGLRYSIRPDGDPLIVDEAGPGGANSDEATLKRFVSGPYRKMRVRSLTLPRNLMHFIPAPVVLGGDPVETTAPIGQGMSVLEPGATIGLIHHQRPDLPYTAMARCLGAINDAEFASFTAQTLLCEPAEATPIVLPNGEPGFDVTFNFLYLPHVARTNRLGTAGVAELGHNTVLRYLPQGSSGPGGIPAIDYRFVDSAGDGTGIPPYRLANFDALLRPEP